MTHAIEVKDLHKSFGSLDVLKGVSLNVDEGEVITVIGPSGSGKSTLARCIARLEKIDSGEIYVYGRRMDGGKMSNAMESELLGMIFQQFNLFPHLSVLENVAIAPMRRRPPENCSSASASATRSRRSRPSFPAASSSAWPSPARWPWIRR